MTLFRLSKIKLVNFRCFPDFELELHDQTTVLLAKNGGGKTSILDALAIGLGAWFIELPVGVGRTIALADAHRQLHEIHHQIVGDRDYPVEVTCSGEVFNTKLEWTRALESRNGKTTYARALALRQTAAKAWAGRKTKKELRDLPVFAYYGTARSLVQAKATENTLPESTSREDGWLGCLDPRSNLKQLLHWFWRESLAEVKAQKPLPHLLGLEDAVVAALGGGDVIGFSYDIQREEPVLRLADKQIVPWSELSDGYRVLIGLVADLAWRSAVLNPQHGRQAAKLAEGVVLIDEVDLFLHPAWQATVLPSLRRAFPKMQLVVTTHSPQVVSSCEPDWLRVVHRDGRVERVTHTLGRDSNALLAEIFGHNPRFPEQQKIIDDLRTKIEQERFPEAEEVLRRLEATLGPTDVDVVRSRLLLQELR